ncbi:hypothetical protein CK203_114370 [Vitis vinifera]|uniref:Uncharacterized protein n=1 Tax=Vitis vinifera TaxID=29760 RepID=A0A438FEM6_VITVI|nr:hypothetical protein CK203_114370 [Vitis vinifera]
MGASKLSFSSCKAPISKLSHHEKLFSYLSQHFHPQKPKNFSNLKAPQFCIWRHHFVASSCLRPEEAIPQLPRAVRELPLCGPTRCPPHVPDSAPQRRYHTRRAVATPVAPTQIPPRSPPIKKVKTSEPGESSGAPWDSQSQPPPTRRPIASSPIKGNSDCRSRAFHVEAYFDHSILRQQPELRDSYRLLERLLPVYDYSWRPGTTSILFTIDGHQGIMGARQIAEAFHIPYAQQIPLHLDVGPHFLSGTWFVSYLEGHLPRGSLRGRNFPWDAPS